MHRYGFKMYMKSGLHYLGRLLLVMYGRKDENYIACLFYLATLSVKHYCLNISVVLDKLLQILSDENVHFLLTFCSVPPTSFWNDPSFLVKLHVLCMDLICCSHSLMRSICWWRFGAPQLVIHFKASLSLRCGYLSYNCSRALTISPAPICFPLIDSYLRGSGPGTFQSAYVAPK